MSRYEALEKALSLDIDVSPDLPITGDLSPVTVAKVCLRASLLKKREVWDESMLQTQEKRALDLFLESNTACKGWTWEPDHVMDGIFMGELQSWLHDLLDPQHEPDSAFDLRSIMELAMPGPGAARLTNSDNFFTKMFASKASATSKHLFSLYWAAIVDSPWAEAENYRHRAYGSHVVEGNAWFSVAKNREIRRSCATEPSVNMLLQKALGTWVEERLKRKIGLDLSRQPNHNRVLARLGSETGLYGTVDLKSASDRNSMAMICKTMPPMFTKWVAQFRSPNCRLPSGEEVVMHMCSSMGNGFTFPLQTALFAGVVITCYKLMGLRVTRLDGDVAGHSWAVFGDDIIVRREAYDYVCRQLRKLGHVVNDHKSFNTGGFRESCGSDYVAGYNVRGVYIRSLETTPEVYSAINRLSRWSAMHGVNLSHTLALLLGWVKFQPIPFEEADSAGIKVPHDDRYTKSVRPGRQTEQRVRDWQCLAYQATVTRTRRAVVSSIAGRREKTTNTKERVEDCYHLAGNQAGWMVTALGGFVATPPYVIDRKAPGDLDPDRWIWPTKRNQPRSRPDPVIGLRTRGDDDVRWQVKWRTTSSWDVVPLLAGPQFGEDRGAAWQAVAGNLELLKFLPRD